jgi:hypothetical protein
MFAKQVPAAFAHEFFRRREFTRPVVTLALVLLLHVFVVQLWGLDGTRHRIEGRQSLAYALIDGPHLRSATVEDLPLQLQSPARPPAAQPVIEIAVNLDRPEPRLQGSDVETVLPPRPDPASPNLAPVPPRDIAVLAGGRSVLVVVRALVLESGAIGDAVVAGSCGVAALDALALRQVKDSWHFLPALSRGKPVRDWISVEVLLRS